MWGVIGWLGGGVIGGLGLGLVSAITAGLTAAFLSEPEHPTHVELRLHGIPRLFLLQSLGGILAALAFGFAVGLSIGLAVGHPSAVAVALASGVVCSLAAGIPSTILFYFGLPADLTKVSDPITLLRLDRTAAVARGLSLGVAGALPCAIAFNMASGLQYGVAAGFAAVLTGFVITGLGTTAYGGLVISRAWFALRGRLPWSLMAFLADARTRGVLRQAGGVFQFRHALLQDRLFMQGRTHMTGGANEESGEVRPWRLNSERG
jgi:hypothetical protein